MLKVMERRMVHPQLSWREGQCGGGAQGGRLVSHGEKEAGARPCHVIRAIGEISILI